MKTAVSTEKFCVRVVTLDFRSLRSDIFAKTKMFAKPFLPVSSNLLSQKNCEKSCDIVPLKRRCDEIFYFFFLHIFEYGFDFAEIFIKGFQLLMQIVLLHRSHRGSMSSLQDGLVAKQICVENCDTVPLLNCILFNSLKIGLWFAIFSLSPPPNLESSGYQLDFILNGMKMRWKVGSKFSY